MSTKKETCNNCSNIQLFYYEGLSVRTLYLDGEIWFVAKDVADILGYKDAYDATRLLDDDEKALMNTNENKPIILRSIQDDEEKQTTKRGNPNIIIISEAGLYALVLRSNKPDAKAFSRWVRHDVLTSIRKTGQFALEKTTHDYAAERQLHRQQTDITSRIAFWSSIYAASADLFRFLPTTSTDNWHDAYVIPEAVENNEVDRHELKLLQGMVNNVKEFLDTKILLLGRKSHIIETLFND